MTQKKKETPETKTAKPRKKKTEKDSTAKKKSEIKSTKKTSTAKTKTPRAPRKKKATVSSKETENVAEKSSALEALQGHPSADSVKKAKSSPAATTPAAEPIAVQSPSESQSVAPQWQEPRPKASPSQETKPPAPKQSAAPQPARSSATQAAAPQPAARAQQSVSVPKTEETSAAGAGPKIILNETITVKDLAERINKKVGDVLMRLLKMGVRASINQRLEVDSATLIAQDFGFDVDFQPIYSEEALENRESEDSAEDLKPRSPIVTIMGHVDHGKTSLLDAIRESSVVDTEAGGITQHIGAYKIKAGDGAVVFLDTPGHEAFTAMRARGAQVTDIVILVVAADDGVMPQTIEAIDHAKAAGVPIVVAVNKIDLPQAKPDRVKQELSQYDLAPEEWGGKTIFVEVSAKKQLNIDKLLEMLLLEAELLELKANPDRPAQGVVIESRLDPKRGPVATVLVRKGTLKVGDTFVCGVTSGRVRALLDDRGRRMEVAGPSTPAEILGFSEPAQLGDKIAVLASDREAREIVERRRNLSREQSFEKKRHLSLEMLSQVAKTGKVKELNLIVKADVQGSVEALKDSIEKIPSQEIRVRVIHSGVGGVTSSDVSLAAASDAVIIGFNVRPEAVAEDFARKEGVDIKTYRIIYEVVSEIQAAIEGLLEPEERENTIGRLSVRQVFKTPAGKVAGCMVAQGKITRTSLIRILRDSKIVYEGTIASLRRFKDDVKEVEQGYECGVSIDNFSDINPGDTLEVYVKEKIARKLGA